MANIRLLIADDDTEMRGWLRIILRTKGYFTAEAVNGPELLSVLLTEEPFDVVISDIRMPIKTGLETAAVARHMGIAAPFIFITGCSSEYSEKSVQPVNPATLLYKPFKAEDLLFHIQRFLDSFPRKATAGD